MANQEIGVHHLDVAGRRDLAGGDPAKEIADCAQRENCDLIAMTTHGHRGLSDVIRGSVASELRHITMVPILMVRAKPGTSPPTPRPAS